jgi:tRNA(fMet)-specific endonuclease VapC
MAIIFDADVVIRGEKGTFDLAAWMASRSNEPFAIAAITVAELWHGVERATAAHRARRERYIRGVLEVLPTIPYTEATALEHARIWASLEASGQMIGPYELIVAATALESGSTVATFNRRHFESVSGLKVIEPK